MLPVASELLCRLLLCLLAYLQQPLLACVCKLLSASLLTLLPAEGKRPMVLLSESKERGVLSPGVA